MDWLCRKNGLFLEEYVTEFKNEKFDERKIWHHVTSVAVSSRLNYCPHLTFCNPLFRPMNGYFNLQVDVGLVQLPAGSKLLDPKLLSL